MTVALHFLVAWSGSLHLAMTAHFLYDLLAGFLFVRIRDGCRSEPTPASR